MMLRWWLSRVLACVVGAALRFTVVRGINGTAESEGSVVPESDGTVVPEPIVCPSFNTSSIPGLLWHPKQENYALGETVTFSCDTGYRLLGEVTTKSCQNDSVWSAGLPNCYRISCSGPPSSTELSWTPFKSLYYYNDSVEFICHSNWKLVGSSSARCNENGSWTPTTPECLETWCAAPPLIPNATYSTNTEPNIGSYSVDTIATYSCNSDFALVGSAELICLPNSTWTLHDMSCQYMPVATSTSPPSSAAAVDTQNNTSSVSHTCGSPVRQPPRPNLIIQRVADVIHYSCDEGYVLFGINTSHCLNNGSWLGTLPKCIAPATAVLAEPSPATTFRWEQVFIAYSDWSGQYKFHGERVDFQFEVHAVQLDAEEAVTGLFSEQHAHFEVKGFQDSTGGIVMEIVRIIHAGPGSARYNPMDWHVQGHLVENECTWSYVGQIHSKISGFGTLSMYTTRDDVSNDAHCAQVQNMTLIIVSITLACILVVILGIIAIICVRRTGGIRSSGHRTLTSFENPVYEYENSLK